MKMAVSGHRTSAEVNWELVEARLRGYLRAHKTEIEALHVGLAAGFDMLAARIALEEGIHVIGCVPFQGHHNRWNAAGVSAFRQVVAGIKKSGGEIRLVSKKIPHSYGEVVSLLMQRNEYMIDRADSLLVAWDGRKSGGTYAAVNYAEKLGKPVGNLCGNGKSQGPKPLVYYMEYTDPDEVTKEMYRLLENLPEEAGWDDADNLPVRVCVEIPNSHNRDWQGNVRFPAVARWEHKFPSEFSDSWGDGYDPFIASIPIYPGDRGTVTVHMACGQSLVYRFAPYREVMLNLTLPLL